MLQFAQKRQKRGVTWDWKGHYGELVVLVLAGWWNTTQKVGWDAKITTSQFKQNISIDLFNENDGCPWQANSIQCLRPDHDYNCPKIHNKRRPILHKLHILILQHIHSWYKMTQISWLNYMQFNLAVLLSKKEGSYRLQLFYVIITLVDIQKVQK